MLDLLFIGLLQVAAGAPADTPAPAADQTAAPADQASPAPTTTGQEIDPSQVVRCRTTPSTGSRVRRLRICTTPAQDAERARANRRTVNGMQNDNTSQPRDFTLTGGGEG